jgi:hypothetical protein
MDESRERVDFAETILERGFEGFGAFRCDGDFAGDDVNGRSECGSAIAGSLVVRHGGSVSLL